MTVRALLPILPALLCAQVYAQQNSANYKQSHKASFTRNCVALPDSIVLTATTIPHATKAQPEHPNYKAFPIAGRTSFVQRSCPTSPAYYAHSYKPQFSPGIGKKKRIGAPEREPEEIAGNR